MDSGRHVPQGVCARARTRGHAPGAAAALTRGGPQTYYTVFDMENRRVGCSASSYQPEEPEFWNILAVVLVGVTLIAFAGLGVTAYMLCCGSGSSASVRSRAGAVATGAGGNRHPSMVLVSRDSQASVMGSVSYRQPTMAQPPAGGDSQYRRLE